jgi:uncharacterized protein (TIGR02391 family)
MMKSLQQLFPPLDDLLTLPAEQIAPILLEYLQQHGDRIHRYNLMLQGSEFGQYAGRKYDEAARVVQEAWSILHVEGLIAPSVGDTSNHQWFITRKGKLITSRGEYESYRRGYLLAENSLGPELEQKIRPLFLGGDYDTAVFKAFRELEVRVRDAGGFSEEVLGVPLMRTAFDVKSGPLTDQSRIEGERVATQHLFAGAIGIFKNPSSHRSVSFSPKEAAAIIRFADYLLSWVDSIDKARHERSGDSTVAPGVGD